MLYPSAIQTSIPQKNRTWSEWSRLLLRSLHLQWYLRALDIVLTIG